MFQGCAAPAPEDAEPWHRAACDNDGDDSLLQAVKRVEREKKKTEKGTIQREIQRPSEQEAALETYGLLTLQTRMGVTVNDMTRLLPYFAIQNFFS